MKQFMFVYGTLRPGEYNADRFHGVSRLVARNVVTTGRMRCVFGKGGYPLVDVNGPGVVVGDIIELDTESTRYRAICDMESGAGYVPVSIHVKKSHANRDTGDLNPREWRSLPEYLHCIIWHYPAFDERHTGDIIPDGDWLAYREDER